ncbi:MAG: restriction endonuclease subunit S [Actinomycetes bacterium]
MISQLRRYPAYRDSGLTWLGSVPAHWALRRAKYVYREVDERSTTGDEELLSVSHLTGVTPRREKNVTMFLAESNVGHKRCQPHDLVINTMWAWMAALGVSRLTGLVSPSYGVYRPLQSSPVLPAYANRLLRTTAYAAEFTCRSTGVNSSRLRLYPEEFLRIPILCPPPTEQTAIVRFLDHVDQKVRRHVRAKRRLLSLLTEQRQAIIHGLVTGGLDDAGLREPTGDPWFPVLPLRWQVLPLRRVIRSAIDGPHFSPAYVDDGVPFLSARNVKADRWSLADMKYISRDDCDEFCRRVRPERGDVLYTKGGTTGIARAVDLDFPFQVWVHIAVLKPEGSRVVPEYLAAALNTPRCYEQSQLLTRGATNQDLGLGRMKAIVLPVPPLREQDAIARRAQDVSDYSCRAMVSVRRDIDLVHELHTRLVADVVTGKLDVRDAAAQLPNEIDEELALDDLESLVEDEESGEGPSETPLEEVGDEP